MKKKLVCLICAVAVAGSLLCGCTFEGSKDYDSHSRLNSIQGHNDLYYYTDTNIVYIVFNECVGECGYGYMTPYYSENGKLCRYVDGKIVEVE